ncbi:MAG: hypothetical protein ACRESZ_18815 [Methylococcales bacterium]
MTGNLQSISGVLLLAIAVAVTGSSARSVQAGSAPIPFQPESLQNIEKRYAGQPFLMVLWSLDCPPCREELKLLSAIKKRKPDFHLVLISTDTPEFSEQLTAVLASHRLDIAESWVFSDAGTSRLRYAIDPGWYGEIPRSYFYDRSHRRSAFSGLLKAEQIEAWLDSPKEPDPITGK